MGWFLQTKGSIVSQTFSLTADTANLRTGFVCDLSVFKSHLEVKELFGKNKATLNYEQITDVAYGDEDEIIEKNKSVIGRALVGGLLLGGIGAVVGGMSGIGKKQETKTTKYLVISYTASDNSDGFLTFEDTQLFKTQKIINSIKELSHIADSVSTPSEPTSTQL